ncbi:MAG: DUF3539 family protein [Goleter apudmare HA4340-LM2]|nr:DUF3539 family protein [Goleter apudmare HA4340-LM2]
MTHDLISQLTAAKTDVERSWIVTQELLNTLAPDLSTAVWAVAVPHWFNAEILAALCPQFQGTTAQLYTELQKLSFVEVFPEHGHNIHQLTRKLILKALWSSNRDEFLTLSARANEYFFQQYQPSDKIEWLYHLITIDTADANNELESLMQAWTEDFRYTEMEYLIQTLLELVESNRITTVTKATIYYWAGNTKFRVAQVPVAGEYYRQALQCYHKLGDRLGVANTLKAIGDILNFLNLYQQALEYYEQALALYSEVSDPVKEANTRKAIGDVLQSLPTLKAIGDVLKFLKLSYQQAWQLYHEIVNRLRKANTLIKVPDELLPEYSETHIMPHQNIKTASVSTKFLPENSKTYIHHPKYGLLQRICTVNEQEDLFISLYAKSLFFLVTAKDMDTIYQPIASNEAKKLLETRLLNLRQNQRSPEYDQLQSVWQRTFS